MIVGIDCTLLLLIVILGYYKIIDMNVSLKMIGCGIRYINQMMLYRPKNTIVIIAFFMIIV